MRGCLEMGWAGGMMMEHEETWGMMGLFTVLIVVMLS